MVPSVLVCMGQNGGMNGPTGKLNDSVSAQADKQDRDPVGDLGIGHFPRSPIVSFIVNLVYFVPWPHQSAIILTRSQWLKKEYL